MEDKERYDSSKPKTGGIGNGSYRSWNAGDELWFSAVRNNDLALLKLILENPDFDIDVVDSNKRTALHLACLYGNSAITLFLVNNGCQLNLEDKNGETPLMSALKGDAWSFDILLKYGASKTNSYGEHILKRALLEEDYSAQTIENILNSGVDLTTDLGRETLCIASGMNNKAAIEQLVRHGADVNGMVEYTFPNTDRKMRHPVWMEVAMQGEHYREGLEGLMSHDPDLSLTNAEGQNFLEWARANHSDDAKIVEYAEQQMAAYENRLLNVAIANNDNSEERLKF